MSYIRRFRQHRTKAYNRPMSYNRTSRGQGYDCAGCTGSTEVSGFRSPAECIDYACGTLRGCCVGDAGGDGCAEHTGATRRIPISTISHVFGVSGTTPTGDKTWIPDTTRPYSITLPILKILRIPICLIIGPSSTATGIRLPATTGTTRTGSTATPLSVSGTTGTTVPWLL